jgi:AraC-like DNA-binding protein
MFVHPGQEHAATMPVKCKGMPIVSIHAQLTPLWGGALEQLFTDPFPALPDLEASQARVMRVIHLIDADPSLGIAMGEALLRDWLSYWAMNPQNNEDPTHAQADPRICQAMEMIHEGYSTTLTVEGLAKAVGLGAVQFRKLFKLVHAAGPKAYLAQYRLRQAAQLLRLDVMSVKEISYACGFTDPHYFHLAFRKTFGCTPMHYRTQSRQSV